MSKFAIFVVILCLFRTLTSCAGNAPATSTSVPTALLTPISTPKLTLDDIQNKDFVGEENNFSVYLVNRTGGTDAAPAGQLLVYNKKTNQVIKMNGLFTVINGGGTIVYDDGKGEYILLSIGTYTSRNAVVLSLNNKNQAVSDFCLSSGQNGGHLFWNDYIVVNNCDTFPNRPWGAGEAPSITAINLKTGIQTVIAKSDLTHQFQINSVDGNSLQYTETFVENEEDWQNPDRQKTEERIYDLPSLSSNQ